MVTRQALNIPLPARLAWAPPFLSPFRRSRLTSAGRLMPPTPSPAKEKEGSFKEAKEAYDKAGDMDSVVRLNVEHLNNLAETRPRPGSP